LNKSCTFTTTS